MILLGELVKRVSIQAGQVIVPLSDLELDYNNLEEIFKGTIAEYQQYKPDFRREDMYLTPAGTSLLEARRVISVRPNISTMWEYVRPMPAKSYDFYNGLLKCNFAGKYTVEYFADYRLSNAAVSYPQTLVTEFETDFKFNLKGHYKKGTLKIKLLGANNITYLMQEDFSSYKVVLSLFTFDVGTNVLTIDEKLGKWLKTGSKLKVKTTVSLPAPLTNNSIYYVYKISDTEIKLCESLEAANAGINLDLSGTASGVLSLESIVDPPYVNLLGDLGNGRINLRTLETEIFLADSFQGQLKIEFLSLYPAVEALGKDKLTIDNPIFLDLFRGNLMMSLGLIKEILKLPDLPFDFSTDAIYNRGEEIKNAAMKLLQDTSDWHNFKA